MSLEQKTKRQTLGERLAPCTNLRLVYANGLFSIKIMSFYFQQPGSAGLLDALNHCSKDAKAGGGIFAFASKGGVEAFFSLPNIAAMLKAGRPFHLVVGIDAITNAETLLCLGEKVAKNKKSLKAQVFLHDEAPSTFHPKFSWFLREDEISLITGSGNLTERGLGKQPGGQDANWEAFSVQLMNNKPAEVTAIEISKWLAMQEAAGTLRSLNDPQVLEKALANARVRYTNSGKIKEKPKAKLKAQATQPQANEIVAGDIDLEAKEVLIRELPKTRGGQGDIGKTAHSKFFGYQGKDKHIFTQYIDLNDTPHAVREDWLFYNAASANYRLEFPESKGKYEIGAHDERMILVAVKLDQRSFRYTILRPIADQANYNKVSALLGPIKKGGRRLMRELFASADDLLKAWDQAPSNLLPVRLPTPEP